MNKFHRIGLYFFLVIILVIASSAPALSQVDTQSWIRRRLTRNAEYSYDPDIAVKGSNIHVVWVDNKPGNYEIFYRRSTNNGATWGKPKRITRNAGSSYSPAIAVSGDNIHLVWYDNTPGNNDIHYKRSTDNGASWGKTRRLSRNAGSSRFPDVAVSGSTIHVVWYDGSPTIPQIFYKRSTNNGSTWGKTKRLSKIQGGSIKPAIAASANYVHLVFNDNDPGNQEIYYKRSADFGINWGKTRRLSYSLGASATPTMAVSSSNVHVTWWDNSPGNAEIWYKRSTTNGSSWDGVKRLTINSGDSIGPSVGVSGNYVHIAWLDFTPGNWEVYHRWSGNNGVTWLKTRRLTRNTGYSWVTAAAVAGTYVHVVWDDNTPGNYEIFYKRGP
jgi:hypothetical protein